MHFPRWCRMSLICLFYLIIVDRIKLTKEFELKIDDIPQAMGYKTAVPKIEHRSMEGWYKMTNGFISVVNRKVSETTVYLLKYANSGKASVSSIVTEVLKMQYPLVICIAVGALFIVVMWITGLTFAICRCCGKCGGKRIQVETSNTPMWRTVLIVLLIIVISLLLVAVICLFITNNAYKASESTLEKTTGTIYDDAIVYLTNVKDQLEFIGITSLDKTLDQINTDLDNVEQFIDREMTAKLTSHGIFKLIGMAGLVSEGSLKIKEGISAILGHSDALNKGLEEFKKALKNIAVKLSQFKTACDKEPKCNEIDSDKFSISDYEDIDVSSIEKIKVTFDELDKEQLFETYSKALQDVKKNIQDIPSEIDRKTKNIQKDIKVKLSKFQASVHNQLKNVTSGISQIINEMKKNHNKVDQIVKSWNKQNIIWYIGLAISTIVTIITVSLLFGLFFGVCGYRSRKQSTKRTSTSNAGGYFLMNAVYWMFFFSGFLMLVTIFLFLFGNLAEGYFCRILNEDNLVTADKIVDELRNFSLHGMLRNIVPSEAFRDCENNQTIFTAFKIDKYIDLNSTSDYSKNINLDEYREKLSDIKLSGITLLTNDVKTSLDKFLKALDLKELDKNVDILNRVITLDIDDQIKVLEELAKLTNSNQKTATELLEETEAVKIKLTNLNEKRGQLLDQLQSLIQNSVKIKVQIPQLVAGMGEAEAVLKLVLPKVVKEISSKFVDTLKGYGDKLKEFIEEGIKTKFAPCGPLLVIFQSIQVVVCKSFIQTLNGFWFALGWGLSFFIPAIIIAVKLSKHFFKMKYTEKQKNQKSDYDIQLIPEDSSAKSWVTEKSVYRM